MQSIPTLIFLIHTIYTHILPTLLYLSHLDVLDAQSSDLLVEHISNVGRGVEQSFREEDPVHFVLSGRGGLFGAPRCDGAWGEVEGMSNGI